MNFEPPLLSADTLNDSTDTTLNQNEKEGDSDNKRQSIKNHPLFPILEYLLVKCEEATLLLATSEIIDKEIQLIALKQKKLCGSLTTGDSELDSLMINALKNLNFQHHELRKVDELCDDFLHRYSARLRARFAQESLFCLSEFESELPPSDFANMLNLPPVATIQTSLGPVSVPLTRNNDLTIFDRKNDPGPFEKPPSDEEKDLCNVCTSSALHSKRSLMPPISVAVNLESVDINLKTKRNSLPRKSVELLRSWLFQNMTHPYPSDEEKHRLSAKTGLNLTQVNNWFINARRRILQPLLDGNSSRLSPEISASLRSQISKLQSNKNAGSSNESTSTVDEDLTSDEDDFDEERSRSPIFDEISQKLKTIRPAVDPGHSQKLCLNLTKPPPTANTANHFVLPAVTKLTSSNYRSIDELIGGSPKRTNQLITHSLNSNAEHANEQKEQLQSIVPKSVSLSNNFNDQSRSTNDERHVIEPPTQNTKQRSRKRSLKVDSGQNLNSLIDGVA